MAVSCGFYNSVNHDRVYDAVQFGEMFDGLITDGVYETVGNRMMVTTVSGMTIRVRSGRAWFNKTWTVNTGDYPLDIPAADVLLPRIDAVILEVDTRLQTRNNSLKIISGRSASNPSKPTLTRANGLYQYPLAWVTVPANARSITSANIEIQVGRDPTPFVTGVVNQTSISDLWNKWDKEFQDWFDEVRDTLSDTGGNLPALTSRVSSLETKMTTVENKVRDIPPLASLNEMIGIADPSHIYPPMNKYISPFRMSDWWRYNYLTDDNKDYDGAKATAQEIKDGTKQYKYISPATLKVAFPQLYDGSLGGTSGGSSGTGTIKGHSDFQITSNLIQNPIEYYKMGDLVCVKLAIEFTVSTQKSYTGFTLMNVPIPSLNQLPSVQGLLSESGSSNYQGQIYRLLGSRDVDNNVSCILECYNTNASGVLTPGKNYVLSTLFVYW